MEWWEDGMALFLPVPRVYREESLPELGMQQCFPGVRVDEEMEVWV